jgi:hypothetical protein
MEDKSGIEPESNAYQAFVLPLNYKSKEGINGNTERLIASFQCIPEYRFTWQVATTTTLFYAHSVCVVDGLKMERHVGTDPTVCTFRILVYS